MGKPDPLNRILHLRQSRKKARVLPGINLALSHRGILCYNMCKCIQGVKGLWREDMIGVKGFDGLKRSYWERLRQQLLVLLS